jgi:hypothetical protein
MTRLKQADVVPDELDAEIQYVVAHEREYSCHALAFQFFR